MPRLPSIQDVLSGRVRVDLETLFRLIHQVNPTDRGLSPGQERRAYEEKSRLQSLAIRRFGDVLGLVPDPRDPEIASLVHLPSGRDGGHVRLDTLEEDARAWARERLASTAVPETPATRGRASAVPPISPPDAGPHPPPGDRPDDAARRGAEALAAYDYDEARTCFEEDLRHHPGRVEAAVALLELLVDVLGLDDDAMDVAGRLRAGVRNHPEVQALVARSAARSGRFEVVFAALPGLAPSVLVEVLQAVAEGALARGDLPTVLRCRELLAAVDAGQPCVRLLDLGVERLRVRLHAPDEAALDALVAGGRWDEARAAAAALLTAWPGSPGARRVQRLLDERGRAEGVAALERRLEEACAAGDPDVARRLIRDLREAGGSAEPWERRVAAILADKQAREDAGRVADVVGRLQREGPVEGVLATFASLPPALRSAVRRDAPQQPALEWVEEALGKGARGDAALAARLASVGGEARQALAVGDLDRCRRLVAPVEPALRDLEAGHALLAGLEDALARRDAARIAEVAPRVMECLDAGDVPGARRLLEPVRATLVVPPASLQPLLDRIRAEEARCATWAEVRDRATAQDWVGLRRMAIPVDDPRLPPDVRAIVAHLDENTRAFHRLEVVQAFGTALHGLVDLHFEEHPVVAVDPAGRCVLAVLRHGWIVGAWVLPEGSGEAVLFSLYTGLRGDLTDLVVEGRRIRMVTSTGGWMVLDCVAWSVEDLRVRPPGGGDQVVEQFQVVPFTPYGWMETRSTRFETTVSVVDLERGVVVRSGRDPGYTFCPVVADPPLVAAFSLSGCRLHDPRGAPLPAPRFERSLGVTNLHRLPGTSGWIALMADPDKDEGPEPCEDDRLLMVARLAPDGRVLARCPLDEATTVASYGFAVSPPMGMAWFLTTGKLSVSGPSNWADDRRLVGIGLDREGNPSPAWEVAVPRFAFLVQDAHAGRVGLVFLDRDGVQVVPLGAEPPRVPPLDRGCWRQLWTRPDRISCSHIFDDLRGAYTYRPAGYKDAATWERVHAETLRVHATDPDALALAAVDACRSGPYPHTLLEAATRLHPDHPRLAFLEAMGRVEEGEWSEALDRRFAGLSADSLTPSERDHLHHLQAWSALMAGDAERARRCLEAADRGGEGRCDLQPIRDLLEAQATPGTPARRVFEHLDEADRAADADDWDRVLALVDTPEMGVLEDIQVCARQARAWRRSGARTPEERWRARLVLATFVAAVAEPGRYSGRGGPFGPRSWSPDALAEEAEACRAWLGAGVEG